MIIFGARFCIGNLHGGIPVSRPLFAAMVALAMALPVPGTAQTTSPATPPATVPATPADPAPAAPAPAPSPALPPPSPAPAPAAPSVAVPAPAPLSFSAYPTLVSPSPNPADMDEVMLPEKPAIAVEGQSTWDEGFLNLTASFRRLLEEANKAGLAPAGKPLARFIDTNDETFKYEALLPIAPPPATVPALSAGVSLSKTPAAKAMRFVHKAPYDEIDSTYEAITAYLDARGVVVEDSFIEEYASDMTNAADPELEINIFVTPK